MYYSTSSSIGKIDIYKGIDYVDDPMNPMECRTLLVYSTVFDVVIRSQACNSSIERNKVDLYINRIFSSRFFSGRKTAFVTFLAERRKKENDTSSSCKIDIISVCLVVYDDDDD